MGKAHRPRAGSLMYWPRKRAKRHYASPRKMSLKSLRFKEAKPIGFAGYKAGMTHAIFTDNRPKSMTKGTGISFAVTVIECPPIKVAGIRLYKKDDYGLHADSDIFHSKLDKELARKIDLPKKTDAEKRIGEVEHKLNEYADVRVIVFTQPKLTGFGKKKPDVFELGLGGNIKEKFAWAKEHLGKEVGIENVLTPGQLLDVHGVTKGKGFQGPVKRMGVTIRQHKAEKTIRGPANLGSWTPHHVGFQVAHAGQMGFHQRTEYNKHLLKISNRPEEVNPKGGFIRYGFVKSPFILVKGSVPGPAKRLITFTQAVRPDKLVPKEAPSTEYISTESKQG